MIGKKPTRCFLAKNATRTAPLIVGSPDDEHAAAVANALRLRSVDPFFVDCAVLESMDFSLSDEVLTLHAAGSQRQIRLSTATRGWIRRLAPPAWRRSVMSGSREAAIRGAWTSLVAAVAGAREVTWLTPLERLFLRENKLLQARAAKALGIAAPQTAVVSQRALIPAELGNSLVVKPLGTATFTDSEGTERVVWARELGRDSPALDSMDGAPFLVQRLLKADRHL